MTWRTSAVFSASILALSLSAEEISVDSLEKSVDAKKFPTVGDFVESLPADLRANFTLLKNTDSSQAASETAPRVVLFGRTGKLLVAFNGGDGAGGDTVELIQFREPGRYELREIRFVPGKPAVISDANPERCTKCHGDPPLPRWSSYFLWPNAFGGNDDALVKASKDAADFKAWKEKRKEHARYKHLVIDGGKNAWAPYFESPEERGKEIVEAEYRRLAYMPNTRFTKLLVRNTARLLFATIKKSPMYERYRERMLLWAFGCEARSLKLQKHEEAVRKMDDEIVGLFKKQHPQEALPKDFPRHKPAYALYRLLGLSEHAVRSEFGDKPRPQPDVGDLALFDGLASQLEFLHNWVGADLAVAVPAAKKYIDLTRTSYKKLGDRFVDNDKNYYAREYRAYPELDELGQMLEWGRYHARTYGSSADEAEETRDEMCALLEERIAGRMRPPVAPPPRPVPKHRAPS